MATQALLDVLRGVEHVEPYSHNGQTMEVHVRPATRRVSAPTCFEEGKSSSPVKGKSAGDMMAAGGGMALTASAASYLFGGKAYQKNNIMNGRYSNTASGTWGFRPHETPWNQGTMSRMRILMRRLMYGPAAPMGGSLKETFNWWPEWGTARYNCKRSAGRRFLTAVFGFRDGPCIPIEEEPGNYNWEFSRRMHNSNTMLGKARRTLGMKEPGTSYIALIAVAASQSDEGAAAMIAAPPPPPSRLALVASAAAAQPIAGLAAADLGSFL